MIGNFEFIFSWFDKSLFRTFFSSLVLIEFQMEEIQRYFTARLLSLILTIHYYFHLCIILLSIFPKREKRKKKETLLSILICLALSICSLWGINLMLNLLCILLWLHLLKWSCPFCLRWAKWSDPRLIKYVLEVDFTIYEWDTDYVILQELFQALLNVHMFE